MRQDEPPNTMPSKRRGVRIVWCTILVHVERRGKLFASVEIVLVGRACNFYDEYVEGGADPGGGLLASNRWHKNAPIK